MHEQPTEEKGFIKLLILVLIALIAVRFLFDFDVIFYVSSEQFTSFARTIWRMVIIGWTGIIDGLVLVWAVGKDLVLEALEIVKSWIQ